MFGELFKFLFGEKKNDPNKEESKINIFEIPLDKKIEDFTEQEHKQIAKSITIYAPDKFTNAYEQYYKHFNPKYYDYKEAYMVEPEIFKRFVNDIYLHKIAEQQQTPVTWQDVKNRYPEIPKDVQDTIISIESSRLMGRIHFMQSKKLGNYWHKTWDVNPVAPAWINRFDISGDVWFLSNDETIENWIMYVGYSGIKQVQVLHSMFKPKKKKIKVYWQGKIKEYTKKEFILFLKENKLEYTFDKELDLDLYPDLLNKLDDTNYGDCLTLRVLKNIYPKGYFTDNNKRGV